MMKKIIAGIAAAALAVSAMATAAFAATETKTIDVDLYNGTGATTDLITYTATATVKLPTTLTATTGATITSDVNTAAPLLGAGDEAKLTEVKILGAVANATGVVTASVLGTEAGKFAKGDYAEVTVVYTFENATDNKKELNADQLKAVNTELKDAKITLDDTNWKSGTEAIGVEWESAAIGDTTAVKNVKTSNAEDDVNKAFKLKAAEKAALLEAGAAKVALTIVSESNYTAGTEYAATIGDATVKVKPAADTKTLTFETDLTALYSAEYDEWATLSVTAPACLTAKLAISYEAEVEETDVSEDTTAPDESDVTEDTTAPEDTSAEDTTVPEGFISVDCAYTDGKTPSFTYNVNEDIDTLNVSVKFAEADGEAFNFNDWCGYGVAVTLADGTKKYYQYGGAQVSWAADFDGDKVDDTLAGVGTDTWLGTVVDLAVELAIPVDNGAKVEFYTFSWDSYAGTQYTLTLPEEKAATAPEDTTAEGDTGADAGEGEDGKGDNTETGVVLAVVPAIVAGAALVVSRKRK